MKIVWWKRSMKNIKEKIIYFQTWHNGLVLIHNSTYIWNVHGYSLYTYIFFYILIWCFLVTWPIFLAKICTNGNNSTYLATILHILYAFYITNCKTIETEQTQKENTPLYDEKKTNAFCSFAVHLFYFSLNNYVI